MRGGEALFTASMSERNFAFKHLEPGEVAGGHFEFGDGPRRERPAVEENMSSFNPRFSQQALALHVDAEWLGGDVPFICDDCDVKSSWLRPGRGARPDNLAPGVRDGNCAHNADAIGYTLVTSDVG